MQYQTFPIQLEGYAPTKTIAQSPMSPHSLVTPLPSLRAPVPESRYGETT